MALNRLYAQNSKNSPQVAATGPHIRTNQIPLSGDPCVLGKIPGVALEDFDPVTGEGVMQEDGIFNLSVKAEGGALAAGAIIYFDLTDDTTPLNDDSGGVRFGYTLDAIGNGLTATVRVQIGN